MMICDTDSMQKKHQFKAPKNSQKVLSCFKGLKTPKKSMIFSARKCKNVRDLHEIMKYNVVVNYYLVILSFKFHEDLCINVHALVVNARVLITRCAHVYDLCMLICARTFMKFETFKLVSSWCWGGPYN